MMAFEYNQGNPLAGTTSSTPTKAAAAQQAAPKATTSSKSTVDKSILNTLGGLSQSLGALGGIVEKLGSAGSTPVTPASGPSAAEQYAANQAELLKQQQAAQAASALASRQSAYDLLFQQFSQYGLGALVEPLKDLVQQNVSPSEFSLRLQQTDAYKKRFSANADRISKGLTALSPAEYIALEDQYQNVMRNYGLPASYYAKDSIGTQSGFNQLLANDVSATELEDRVSTAQNRVINANPEVKQALRQFYPDITDGDILAYSLDPTKALTDIKRKVTASEIGGAALSQGLSTSQTAAEGLAGYGINKAQAQQGYSTISEFLPTGQKLSQIYQESPYTQTQAEQEIFNLADSATAAKKRKRLSQLETATFSGSSGAGGGALNRDRAGSYQQYGAPGAGAY
jgi:hypothetical protein